jgi:peptidyl-prolyl cis-trans isomerase SurA
MNWKAACTYNSPMRKLPVWICVTVMMASAADVTVVEEIVCKVNSSIVTRTDLDHDRRDAEAELRHQGLSGRSLQDTIELAMKGALRQRIDRLLLIQKAKELDVKVDNEVAKQMANIQRNTGIADPEKFQAYVKEQRGMPFEDYKNEMKESLLVEKVIRQEVSSTVKIRREDQEKYYEEHKADYQRQERLFLSNLYVSTVGKDAAGVSAAERKAKDLAARARRGEKFSELVMSSSDDANAPTGGEMPPFEKGMLAKEVEDAVWSKDKGYISDPIKLKDPAGFYVFKVEDHQKAGLAQFEEVQSEVEDKLFRPKMEPALRAYLTKLRAEAFLQIKPGYEDLGAAPGKNTAWQDPAQLKPETVTKEEVAAQTRHRKFLWLIPIPGTSTKAEGTSSSH